MNKIKVGVLGGTFDPVHRGHLIIAEEVRQKLGLGEVLLVPAGNPRFKESAIISPAEHRLEMIRLAIADSRHFRISTVELERPGTTYTVDTIEQLKNGAEEGSEFYFIAGYDSLAGLPGWKDPVRLLELCRFAAVRRPGFEEVDPGAVAAQIGCAADRILVVDMPVIDISSSGIRRRVSLGLSVKHMVPNAVETYIIEHGLYKQDKH